MTTTIKITELTNIGANIAYNTLVPVVNMLGNSLTQKANLQIVGNLILNGAGGSFFPAAAQAINAQTVSNAAQPAITSVGTLTSLNVSGNITAANVTGGNTVSANFFVGDGSLLTNVSASQSNSISNGNTSVSIPEAGGNVNFNIGNNANMISFIANDNLSANIITKANTDLVVGVDTGGVFWVFGKGGALNWPASGGNIWAIQPNPDSEFEIKSTSNVVISTDISNANSHFTFDSQGIFTAPSNVNLLGSRLNIGPESANITSLLNPTLVIANSGASYIQAAILNVDSTGSSDWSADGAGSSDEEAWTDMGFAGSTFDDANYTITAPGDGYIFVQAYANGLGGNLVLATGQNSNVGDIIFATGGFLTENEFGRISYANNALELNGNASANLGNLAIANYFRGILEGVNSTQVSYSNPAPSGGEAITANVVLDDTGVSVLVEGASGVNSWLFDPSGNLILPFNSFTVNYANGTQVPLGATGPQGATGLTGPAGATGPIGPSALTITNTTDLSNSAASINTTGKVAGLMVFNTTDKLIYVTEGATTTDLWYPSDGGSFITPIP